MNLDNGLVEIGEYLIQRIPLLSGVKLYPFSIKKGRNIYGIVFGSSHPRCVEKFLRTAWKENPENGEANFDIHNDELGTIDLFEGRKLSKIELFQSEFEKEVLGIYVSGHPLDDVKDIWKKNINAITTDFYYEADIEGSRLQDKKQVKLGGIISNLNKRLTKKKEMMAIFELEDLVGSVEAMVFPKAFERLREMLVEDKPVFVTGRVSTEDEADSKLIVEDIFPFDQVPKTLWLKFDDMEKYGELWDKVNEILKNHKGADSVNIRVIKENKLKTLPTGLYGVRADEEIISELEKVLGEKSAVIR